MAITLRSATTTQGRKMAGARSLWRANGMREEHMSRPVIDIVNSFTQFVPGHMHLHEIGQHLKKIIEKKGCFAAEFNTIAIDDGIAMGHDGMLYSLPSRDLIADSVEYMCNAHTVDAMICISNCDKITPGMLMAAGRLNIPTLIVTGGPMDTGCFKGSPACYTDLIEAEGRVERGKMSIDDLSEFEQTANTGPGACSLMGTANCMNMLTEALGMTLTDGALIPATWGKRTALARQAGRQIMELHDRNICPRDIMTLEAFENAIAVDMAIGGSTNAPIHLNAIARHLDVGLDNDDHRLRPGIGEPDRGIAHVGAAVQDRRDGPVQVDYDRPEIERVSRQRRYHCCREGCRQYRSAC